MAEVLQRFRSELDAELRSVVDGSSLPLYNMMRYHLGWLDELARPQGTMSGKGLRPLLCLLACEAVGGDYHLALPAAAALELIHNFSLIHDDIEDGSHWRRHRPTVWRLWGQPQAINAGDGMYALARLSLLRLEGRGIAPQKVLKAAHLLDEVCLKLCEGQYLDLSYETRLDIGIDAYLEMVNLKTAALIGCSLQLGALLGTDNELMIKCLRDFGRSLGLAFQMRDDILGIWGKKGTTGKAPATDIQSKKKSLPVVYGLEKASGEDRQQLLAVYQKEVIEGEDVAQVLCILNGLDARGYAQATAEKYHTKALAELEASGLPTPSQTEFRMVAAFLVEREY